MKYLVFDLDDTLYLERDYVASGFRSVSRWVSDEFGCTTFLEVALRHFEQGCRGDIFNRAFAEVGLPAASHVIEQAVTVYRTHTPDIRLAPDALVTLRRLAGSSDVYVITDGWAETQWAKIRALGVERFTARCIVTGDWGRQYWKPHERAFMLVQNLIGCNPWDCVYIGDNPEKDFHAPKALGWNTVRIRRPGGLHYTAPNLPGFEPDIDVSTLIDIDKHPCVQPASSVRDAHGTVVTGTHAKTT